MQKNNILDGHVEEILRLRKEIKSLRLILKSHADIILMNGKLREENKNLKDQMADLFGVPPIPENYKFH